MPWTRLVCAALAGTTLCVTGVLLDVRRAGLGLPNLLPLARTGPAAAIIQRDFPHARAIGGRGHDGQQFYAIARDPLHLDRVSRSLDRPRYRLQRPLFPVLAWLFHPSGGGPGLIWALFGVGVAGLLLTAVSTGALVATLGARDLVAVLLAAVVPLLGGSLVSLRITVADTLALGLALSAVVLVVRGHLRLAVVAGVLAVLAKESVLLILVGYALWRRDRRAAVLVGVPVVVGLTWALWVRSFAPARHDPQVMEFGLPLRGLVDGAHFWLTRPNLGVLPSVSVIVAVVLGIWALARGGLRSPLGWMVALQLLLLAVVSIRVLDIFTNAARTVMPLTVVALVGLLTEARGGEGPGAERTDVGSRDEPERIAVRAPAS